MEGHVSVTYDDLSNRPRKVRGPGLVGALSWNSSVSRRRAGESVGDAMSGRVSTCWTIGSSEARPMVPEGILVWVCRLWSWGHNFMSVGTCAFLNQSFKDKTLPKIKICWSRLGLCETILTKTPSKKCTFYGHALSMHTQHMNRWCMLINKWKDEKNERPWENVLEFTN